MMKQIKKWACKENDQITTQVLDDGYEKQDMVKWRDAEVLQNTPASTDESEFDFTCLAYTQETNRPAI